VVENGTETTDVSAAKVFKMELLRAFDYSPATDFISVKGHGEEFVVVNTNLRGTDDEIRSIADYMLDDLMMDKDISDQAQEDWQALLSGHLQGYITRWRGGQ